MSDNPLGALSGLLGGSGGGILNSVMKMFQGGDDTPAGDGMAKVVGEFQNSGLGDKVQSWIGTGDNAPVSAQEVERAMGPEVDQIAAQAGVSHQEAANGLADVLPQAVDKLTPEGKMPDMGALGDMLGKFLGGGSK